MTEIQAIQDELLLEMLEDMEIDLEDLEEWLEDL